SPGHCEEREEGPGALHLQVADEFPEQDGEHQVRSASTGSSAAARRAGMRPAANATAASNASVAASTIGEIVGTPTNSLMGSPPRAALSSASNLYVRAIVSYTRRSASLVTSELRARYTMLFRKRLPNRA